MDTVIQPATGGTLDGGVRGYVIVRDISREDYHLMVPNDASRPRMALADRVIPALGSTVARARPPIGDNSMTTVGKKSRFQPSSRVSARQTTMSTPSFPIEVRQILERGVRQSCI